MRADSAKQSNSETNGLRLRSNRGRGRNAIWHYHDGSVDAAIEAVEVRVWYLGVREIQYDQGALLPPLAIGRIEGSPSLAVL